MTINDILNAQRLTNLAIRVFALFLIVFLVLTYVPTINLDNKVKTIIALLVVGTYSVLDLMGVTVMKSRDVFCDIFC